MIGRWVPLVVVVPVHSDLNHSYAVIPGKVTKPAEITGDKNIINTTFRGEVEVTTQTFSKPVVGGEDEVKEGVETKNTPFLFLSLELPPTPLFQDEDGGNVIPQVPLYTVLKKFDGATPTVRSPSRWRWWVGGGGEVGRVKWGGRF